jgi:23S rRNA (cytosine1962-C5)-methyltransferase
VSSSLGSAVPSKNIEKDLASALAERRHLLDAEHISAARLFNGYYEGCPDLVVDLYARTLVVLINAVRPDELLASLPRVQDFYLSRLPWLSSVVLKIRRAQSEIEHRGTVVYGSFPDRRIMEHGVWYAIDLTLSQDASFYLDTRNLRRWLIDNAVGKSVLNTFAYTGSLGVAASTSGAREVIQLDHSKKHLDIARQSITLNGLPLNQETYLVGDFWKQAARLKRAGRLFDIVLLDPPFFAASRMGVVDLQRESTRLINKIRPLVSHDGYLVAVNNALFLRGSEYLGDLEKLCESGYVSIDSLVPVPEDITGYANTRRNAPPADPAPFNHPTKIAILRVKRKDGRKDV